MKIRILIRPVLLTLLYLLSTDNLFSQNATPIKTSGIEFEQQLMWSEIRAKAKAEHKYIFVDCYATWCGPCKFMDKEIYTNDTVGSYMNAHFISVKVQMDKTQGDDAHTKSWYVTSEDLENNYSIRAYPSFLFFGPDGVPLHKTIGAKFPATEFIEVAIEAQDPAKQYYTLVKNYQPGMVDTSELKGLAKVLKYEDRSAAAKVALDYLQRISASQLYYTENIDFASEFRYDSLVMAFIHARVKSFLPKDFRDPGHQEFLGMVRNEPATQAMVTNYVSSLTNVELKEKGNLLLLSGFDMLIQLHDRYFEMFCRDSKEIDLVLRIKGKSEQVTDNVIRSRLIDPDLKKADSAQIDADWDKLFSRVEKEFGKACAKRNIDFSRNMFYLRESMDAENNNSPKKFYWGRKRATQFLLYTIIDSVIATWPNDGDKSPGSRSVKLNDRAWVVFQYNDDKKELERALVWADKAIAISRGTDVDDIDSKANILYKLCRKDEALEVEQKAIKMDPKNAGIVERFRVMQEGKPTWPIDSNRNPN